MHRSERQVEDLGYLGRRVLRPVAQGNDRSALRGKRRHGLEQIAISEGIVVAPGREQSVSQIERLRPVLLTADVGRTVDHDAREPGAEGTAPIEAGQAAKRPLERILGDVVGGGAAACHRQGEPPGGGPVPSEELFTRLFRARQGRGHQTLLVIHSIIRRRPRPSASRCAYDHAWMNGRLAVALLAVGLVLSGCASESGATGEASPSDADKIERCTDRLLANADDAESTNAEDAKRYVQVTYCGPFTERGWVYDDGALSIDAHRWLIDGGSCASARAGEPAQPVPCDQLVPPGQSEEIDCALLRHVRRSEVAQFLNGEHSSRVRCDDGTPANELGVP